MNIRQHSNAKEFLSHAGDYLHRDEARYGLILGLARVVEKYPHRFKGKMPVPQRPPVAVWINKPSTDELESNLLTDVSHFH